MANNGQRRAAEKTYWQFVLEAYRLRPEEQAEILAWMRGWLAQSPARVFWELDPCTLDWRRVE